MSRLTKRFLFLNIYLLMLFLHTCMFPACAFVRENV